MEKYIEFEHIGKTFPGQKALDDVSFSIRKGEIHAIIGENGAGKSTLLNILHGVFPATTGEIKINGKTVKFSNVADAIENGIAKVHQEIVSIPDMTVAENMFMGKEPGKYGIIDKKKMNQRYRSSVEQAELSYSSNRPDGRTFNWSETDGIHCESVRGECNSYFF